MAILLRGKSKCPICDDVIQEGEEATLFPHIVLNQADPLFYLSDAACHTRCVRTSSLGLEMLAESERYLNCSGPGKRKCAVCGQEIEDPDEYFFIAYLGDPRRTPLGEFNYVHLHKAHISRWRFHNRFLALATEALSTQAWKGPALAELIRVVETH